MLPQRLGISPDFRGAGAHTRRRAANRRQAFSLVLAVILGLCLAPAPGWGAVGIQVTPTRVVLEGRERTAELSVINGGVTTGTYRIWFKNLRMNEDGTFEEIAATSADRPAEDMIRYAPREITLRPGESQTVRLLLRRPAGLPPGEYRSHLVFAAVPEPSQMDRAAVLGDSDSGLIVQLRPVFGVSVPVIVRHGDLSASVRLTDLDLERGAGRESPATLKLRLERAGEKSVYGDIEATFVPRSGPPRLVGVLRGIAIYPTIPSRSVELPLRELPSGGELRVSYREQTKDGGATLATILLPL